MISRAAPCRGGNSGHCAACSGSATERSLRGGRESLNGETTTSIRGERRCSDQARGLNTATEQGQQIATATTTATTITTTKSRCFVVGSYLPAGPTVYERAHPLDIVRRHPADGEECDARLSYRMIEMQSNRPSWAKTRPSTGSRASNANDHSAICRTSWRNECHDRE